MNNPDFLQLVAADLFGRYGEEISNLTIVFPNRRARLFFAEALSRQITRPIWQPAYLGIDDLVKKLSPLKIADNFSLLADLHTIYKKHKHSAETFDHFYFWGEILIQDFDSIDKYLVDAAMLFKNLSSQKKLEGDFSFLSDEQIKYIQSFWSTFEPVKEGSLQQQFIEIWEVLYPIYTEFKTLLRNKGTAYEGMVYRDIAECIKTGGLTAIDESTYIFVGFNALNACEKALFKHLKNNGKAEFYWDTDDYYMRNTIQEAGLFLRANLSAFPQPATFENTSSFEDDKDITVVSVPSGVLQAKIIPTLLQFMNAPLNRRTAIVLADENLLLPVLYSLPQEADEVNITMGYPLKQTAVYSLAELLIRLQRGCKTNGDKSRFYFKDVLAVIQHPYIKSLTLNEADAIKTDIIKNNRVYIDENLLSKHERLKHIFRLIADYTVMCDYLIDIFTLVAMESVTDKTDENIFKREYIYHFIKTVNQLKNSIQNSGTAIGMPVFLSLLRSVFSGIHIPFSGEPVRGLQVMGLLETRTLDFDNIIMLSLNEGVLPRGGGMPSFIPYNLRKGFQLPAAEQQEAVYAYYFYRLCQRAKKICFVYSSKADEVRTGEMSRYLQQLKYETAHRIKEKTLNYQLNFTEEQPIVIEKSSSIMDVLNYYLGDGAVLSLSPSALSTYIKCPLQFYFKYIARIDETEEVKEDLAINMFGNILHNAMEKLYRPYLNKVVTAEIIQENLCHTDRIYTFVNEAFAEEYYNGDALPDDFHENGSLLIPRDVIARYVTEILNYDARNPNFTPLIVERRLPCFFKFTLNGKEMTVKLSGLADRIDLYNGTIRIIDYKTGGGKGKDKRMKFKGVESMFCTDPNERNSEAFQTFLYALMYMDDKNIDKPVMPALYFVRDINSPDFNPCLINTVDNCIVRDFTPYADEFSTALSNCLQGLFNSEVPFTQTEHTDICKRICAFNLICGRK